MTPRPKYLFDIDFGAPARPVVEEPVEPMLAVSEHVAALKSAEEAAFLRGVVEGRTQAQTDDAARLAGAAQRLAHLFEETARTTQQAVEKAEHEAVQLATLIARKLAGGLIARYPAGEIEALARSIFGHLRAVPHVVVRLNDGVVDTAKPMLDRVAQESGFTGRIMALGEPDIAPGDARIEWADGGVVRDGAQLERMLEEIVGHYLDTAQRRREASA